MDDNTTDPIYREFLLDHYKNPKNKHIIKDPDIEKQDSNPLCGDEISIFIKLGKDKEVEEISFQGSGCVISQASASILTEELQGKNIDDVKNMSREDMLSLLNLKLTPTRVKCAMLALTAIKKGIMEYEDSK